MTNNFCRLRLCMEELFFQSFEIFYLEMYFSLSEKYSVLLQNITKLI